MPAITLKADIHWHGPHVGFVPILLQKSAILAARFRPRFFETSSYYAPLGSGITYQLY
jgi:hypothetical protein